MAFEEVFRSVGLTIARTISFASHSFLFGLVPLLLLVLRPSFASLDADLWGKGRARVARRLEGLAQSSVTATAVATVIALVLQFALVSETSGGEITSEPVLSVLETRFGQLYLLRFPLLAGLAVLLIGRVREWSLAGTIPGDDRGPRPVWWVGWAALALCLLATSSLSGHAAVATPTGLSVLNDLVHLICAATWFTGIVVLALVVPDGWRGREPRDRVRMLAPIVLRFSTVAAVTITLLGITGGVNSFLHVEQLSDLWQTNYGRPILAKIVVFAGILAVGGLNHFVVAKRLEAALAEGRGDSAQRLFRKTIAIELVMALAVIALTGFLVGEARTKRVEGVPAPSGVTAPRTS